MTVPFDDHLTLNRLATVARLVSGAAHEVNNALQVISGTVELLLASPDLPEPLTCRRWSASRRNRPGRQRP